MRKEVDDAGCVWVNRRFLVVIYVFLRVYVSPANVRLSLILVVSAVSGDTCQQLHLFLYDDG